MGADKSFVNAPGTYVTYTKKKSTSSIGAESPEAVDITNPFFAVRYIIKR